MAAILALAAFLAFILGYRFWAARVGRRIFDDRDEVVTPAHELEDGKDYVPTKASILFGHHFTSVAGAAPIIGPCVAAYWGWLPAFLWIVLGAVFMGAVHDFGALVVSARERGRSIADVAGRVVSPRIRAMFLCFVLVLTWLVLAVFAIAIAGQFLAIPSSVLPINIEIIVALVIGWLIYVRKVDALWPSLIALVVLYVFVWIGTEVPLDAKELFLPAGFDHTAEGADAVMVHARSSATTLWVVFLFVYSAIASLLPVWMLLQPRDYINSHQLFVGLGLLFAGIFWANPGIQAPMVREGDLGGLFPMLFVTIACGAISGFHGLVSSGTTSKQLDRLRDARPIGYGAMLGEGTLAVASLLAAVSGIALVGSCILPSQGSVDQLSWSLYYGTMAHAERNGPMAFVLGGGAFLQSIGLPANVATTLMSVLLVSFAATTLDTATRIQRFIVAELGAATRLRLLEDRRFATLVAVVPAILLALVEAPDAYGHVRQVAWLLWPIFGASNQMLAALTLGVLSLYYWQRKKPILPLLLPMLFVMTITVVALVVRLKFFLDLGNVLLVGLTVLLLALVLWMLLESLSLVMSQRRRGKGFPGNPSGDGSGNGTVS
ncbi:MAG: carbon starvation protein A [Planctomycetota bacterium]